MADDGVTSTFAGSRGTPHRPVTPIQLGLAGLAVAAIIAIVVIALTASTPNAVSGSNTWLPTWVRILGEVVFAVIVTVHLWHLRAPSRRERAWHTGHVLTALAMMDMFAPTNRVIVAGRIGKLVFAAAVIATLVYIGVVLVRAERLGWLWPALAADFAAMVYMFVMPVPGLSWLTWILVGWLTLQAVGWLTGALPARADLGSPRGGPAAAACGFLQPDLGVRLSLAAMNLGMAYMFVAMELGMAPAPGMVPMPGMPGM